MTQHDGPMPVGLEDGDDFEASFIEASPSGDDDVTNEPTIEAVAADIEQPDTEQPDIERPGSGAAISSTDGESLLNDETATMPSPQPNWVGKRMGHFKLLRLLGEGTMGRVILAQDMHLNRLVALKVLRRRIRGMAEEQRVRQFLREAQAAAKIEHPNVVRIFEINEEKGWWYVAMELVEGETFRDIIKATGALPPVRACHIVADAASALTIAHAYGIIHRDIKPGNLMIARDGRAKLTDFGLVRFNDPNDPFSITRQAVGTPQYMAPEIAAGKPGDAAVDIYSLGVTLYYALAGQPPFMAKTVSELLKMHRSADPPDVRTVAPDVPESLALFVQRAMAKDPEQRPTAAEFAAALRVELIGSRSNESSIMIGVGESSAMLPPGALQSQVMPADSFIDSRSRRLWQGVIAVVGSVLALAILVPVFSFWLGGDNGTATSPRPAGEVFAETFPDAPADYGIQTIPAPPVGDLRSNPPAFSWIGKVDTTGLNFVASEQGQHYYPIDAPAAALIRHDQFKGYRTEQEARDAGKTPAP